MPKAQDQILQALRRRHMATARELSRDLYMTPANVRHHLANLKAQNLVEVISEQRAGERGRPSRVYALTHQARESNVDLLVDALLKALLANNDAGSAFTNVVPHLFGQAPAGSSFLQRLNQATTRLNALKYQCRWEASPEGPRVILGNCPYAAVLAENPELCQMDQAALEHLLGIPMQQVARLERGPQGAPRCIFIRKET